MSTLILRTTAALLHPLLLLFSVYLLLHGHDEPGGGFVGGLVAGVAFALQVLANGTDAARRLLRFDPQRLAATGLGVAAASGLVGALLGKPFLSGQWVKASVPVLGNLKFGTPVLFDLGVYLLVVGVVCVIVFTMAED